MDTRLFGFVDIISGLPTSKSISIAFSVSMKDLLLFGNSVPRNGVELKMSSSSFEWTASVAVNGKSLLGSFRATFLTRGAGVFTNENHLSRQS